MKGKRIPVIRQEYTKSSRIREAKKGLGHEGTAKRWQLADRNVLNDIYGCIKSAR